MIGTTSSKRAIVRAAPRMGGGYVMYDSLGKYLGHTAGITNFGNSEAGMRSTAARMAHNQELFLACQAVDRDYEATGTVSHQVVDMVRQLLTTVASV